MFRPPTNRETDQTNSKAWIDNYCKAFSDKILSILKILPIRFFLRHSHKCERHKANIHEVPN